MREDFPDYRDLYSTDGKRRLAYHSAIVEAIGYCRWTRLQEVAEFSYRMGYRRAGIAYCPDMAREASLVMRYLQSRSLDVVIPPGRTACDPPGQARLLAVHGTQFNVIAGMCVGHDSIFIRASQAPVTCLVARDTRLRHNPAAALYTSGSYFRSTLFGRGNAAVQEGFHGDDLDALGAASSDVSASEGVRCRVEEVMKFARRLGASHLGLSFCVGFRNEALLLTMVLEANGFRVSSSCCKTGAVPKEEFGLLDSQKVRPDRPEMACNPLAQAELLNRERVQLALLLGQCVGHDSAAMMHLKAPAVCVAAKDRVLAHNTVVALYDLEG
jgi:uncharacterized metal-binding protein